MSRLESERIPRSLDNQKIENANSDKQESWNAFEKEKAIEAFESADNFNCKVRLEPQLQELFDNAKVLMQSGELLLAKRVFIGVIQKEPYFDPAYDALIYTLKELGQYQEALEFLQLRISQHPSFSAYYAFGDELYGQNLTDEAELAFLEALKYPHIESVALFNLYKNLGNIALRKKDFLAAEENYNRAFTIDDQNDVLLVNFGSLAIHRGQLDRAVRCFRQAVALNPANPKAWVGLGMIHREYGDYELSWANIEKALDFDSSNETAAKLVAEWGMKDNEIEKAIRLLSAYAQNCPQDAFNHMMLSKYYYLLGNMRDAFNHIENAYEINPELNDLKELRDIIGDEYKQLGY